MEQSNMIKRTIILTICVLFALHSCIALKPMPQPPDPRENPGTLMVAIFVRNKAHILPYFFNYLEKLDYPKDKMSLWIRADHNIDNSVEVVQKWLDNVRDEYRDVDFKTNVVNNDESYPEEYGPCDWPDERYQQIIYLKQTSLDIAKQRKMDFILYIDCDNLLVNPNTLWDLMAANREIIGPLLNNSVQPYYSNFWGATEPSGWYKRSRDYMKIKERHHQGVVGVAVVHSTFLIRFNMFTKKFVFYPPPPDYTMADNDLVYAGLNANRFQVSTAVINEDFYGVMQAPMRTDDTLEDERAQFEYMRTECIARNTPLEKISYIDDEKAEDDNLGFDQIYVLNLESRPDRKQKMLRNLDTLSMTGRIINVAEGSELVEWRKKELGVQMLPGYEDPYNKRPMNNDEMTMFMAHFTVWNDVVRNNYSRVLVFEDDCRVAVNFRQRMKQVLKDIRRYTIKWDFIYLGRRVLKPDITDEPWLGRTDLVWPAYSHLSVSYMLSNSGASKLLDQKPLKRMLPVGEYIPVLFGKHPREDYLKQFETRNLVALSMSPVMVTPQRFDKKQDRPPVHDEL